MNYYISAFCLINHVRLLLFLIGVVMLALTYGEHVHADVAARKLSHYINDGVHIAWLYGGLLGTVMLGMRRCWERLVLVAIFAWGAAEGAMTALAGLIGDPRVTPSQWSGWLGEMLRLPLAAIGLSAACVMACWLWSPANE